jgi:hypothetical protein
MNEDKDPDIVNLVLPACRAEGFDVETSNLIEREIYKKYGGRKVYIPKKNPLTEDRKNQAIADVLNREYILSITSDQGHKPSYTL